MKLTLSITTSGEFTEGPEVAVVEIDDHLKSRILQLASAVKILNVYSVREFNGYPTFLMRAHDQETENGPIVLREPEGGFEEMACRTECVTLNVTDSGFYWNGYVKHTDIRFETQTVPLSDLGIAPEPAHPTVETLKKIEASICTGSINDPAIQQVVLREVRKTLLQPDDPYLGIVLEGGLVQAIVTDAPKLTGNWKVMVIDYDTDGADPELFTPVPQGDGSLASAWVHADYITEAEIDLKAVWASLK